MRRTVLDPAGSAGQDCSFQRAAVRGMLEAAAASGVDGADNAALEAVVPRKKDREPFPLELGYRVKQDAS